jgi:hypothetical protein
MAMKYIKALLLPNLSSVMISAVASTAHYENGVALLSETGRMNGWIEIYAEDPELRAQHFAKVLRIVNEVINNPRRSVQPDFSFLTEGV